jgi:hypothetical protein
MTQPPGRSHRTVNTQVDRQDGIAIPINIGQLIQARLVLDDFGVVSCDCPHVVVEACLCVGPSTNPRGCIATCRR